jgi:hypothetical protein
MRIIFTRATSESGLALDIARRLTPIDMRIAGINRTWSPRNYGTLNLADAKAYQERLAARGERDES